MKNRNSLIILAGSLLLIAACSRNDDGTQNTSLNTSPVETNPPNANYPSAFSGQTRVNAVRTSTAFNSTIISTALVNPWGITTLPDGRLLITEKAGRIRIVTAAGNLGEAISGIPQVNSSGQGGLLGLTLDPDFVNNRMIYWSFSEAGASGNLTAIAKGRLSNDETTLEAVTVIFRAGPAYAGNLHYGGRVIFDQTGNLIVSTGERSDAGIRVQAQSTNSSLGKLIRITRNGLPAPGNPFLAQPDVRPELYSIGHRNPQGLARHPLTGDIWQSEHGPRGGDELNRIEAGANFGWPIITYGIEYSGQPIGGAIQQRDGMAQPVYYWDPVVSPSGMTFYNSDRIPEWRNNLFIGALSGMHIVRLTIANNRVTGEERLLINERQRFRDITQGTDGALYAITDAGRLYRIDRQ